jgi:hypothetical protein
VSPPYEVATLLQPLIGEVAVPVVVMIDDAHLLDSFSQEVLGFVARRLSSAPIVVVLASEETQCPAPLLALPTVYLGELSQIEAAQVIRHAGQGRPPLRIARQIAARAGGNPAVLLDVVSRLSDAQLTGRAELGRYLPRSPVLQSLLLR